MSEEVDFNKDILLYLSIDATEDMLGAYRRNMYASSGRFPELTPYGDRLRL